MTSGIEFTPEQVVEKKAKMIAWLEESVKGTFTQACAIVNIARKTGYNWREEDEEFLKAIDEARAKANESGLDFIEGKIMQLINEGNVVATIFALKCLGKSRGWIERHDMNFNHLDIKVTYESSREYLAGKLLSISPPRSEDGETLENEPIRSIPAPI